MGHEIDSGKDKSEGHRNFFSMKVKTFQSMLLDLEIKLQGEIFEEGVFLRALEVEENSLVL